jgi:hypothetical protein
MLSRIGEVQAPLPAAVALLIGILTTVVVNGPKLWAITTHINTVVHEGAHAVVGLGTGHSVNSVTMDRDGGGGTVMAPARGIGYAFAALVGYIGPSIAGLIAAELISIGRIVIVLWLGLLLLAAMLLMVRNWFGRTVILGCGVPRLRSQGSTRSGQQADGRGHPRWDDCLLAVGVVFPVADRHDRRAPGRRSHSGLTWCL